MNSANGYRDDGSEERFAELSAKRRYEVVRLTATVADVFAQRVARATAGGVASLGGVLVVVATNAQWAHGHRGPPYPFNFSESRYERLLYELFLGSLLLAVVAYLMGTNLGLWWLNRALHPPRRTGSARAAIVQLEASEPQKIALDLLKTMAFPGVALPLVAQSLLGPLTFHLGLLVLLTCSCCSYAPSGIAEFGAWILFLGTYFGFAHLVFAAVSLKVAQIYVDAPASDPPIELDSRAGFLLLVAMAGTSGCIAILQTHEPFGSLYGVIVFAILTLAFVAWRVRCMQRRIVAERAALAIAFLETEPQNLVSEPSPDA